MNFDRLEEYVALANKADLGKDYVSIVDKEVQKLKTYEIKN